MRSEASKCITVTTLTCAFAFLFFLFSAGLLVGQGGGNGVILGTVTDNSGAVVANAKVEVANKATGIVTRTETTSSGDFTVPSLNPGVYIVSVEAPGFQKTVTTGIVLTVDQKARVNASLKPGAVETMVEVSGQAVTLCTDTSALSQVVSQHTVEARPLTGRNFMPLLLVGGGAVDVGGEGGPVRAGGVRAGGWGR